MLEFLLWILSTCPHSEHNVPPIQNASPQLVPVRQVQVGDVSCRGHDGFKTRRSMLIWGWTWGNHWWWPEKGSQKEKDVYQNWHFWQFKKKTTFFSISRELSRFSTAQMNNMILGSELKLGIIQQPKRDQGPLLLNNLRNMPYILHLPTQF